MVRNGRVDRTEEQTRAIVELLDLPVEAAVLDVACGFGRIAGLLHHHGFRVTGIDISQSQLQLAAKTNPGPSYLLADMPQPPPGPFDGVVNVYSSFGYFDESAQDFAALQAWYRVLRHGGVLVMDLMHRDQLAYLRDSRTTSRGRCGRKGPPIGSAVCGPPPSLMVTSPRRSASACTPSPSWSAC